MEARTSTPTIEESTIVERVARIVSSGHDWRGAKPDYTRLAAELEPAIPFDILGIVLLRHDRQSVRVTVCRREAGSWVAQYHQHPLGGSRIEQLLGHPEMEVHNYLDGLDGPPAECGDSLSGYPQLQATLIAPLVVGENVLGSLELGSAALNAYADETLQRLIRAVVHVLAAAIESAQTGGSVEIQNRQRHALKQVSNALTSTMDLPTILERIVAGIAESLHVASAIVTLGRCKQGLYLEAQSGLDPVILRKVMENDATLSDRSIVGLTLLRRQPFVSQDIDTDGRFPANRNFATELAIRSIFSYPLVTETTIYGALLLCSPEPGGFTPLKADILSLFASQATVAIHTGMLLEATQQRRRFQEAIEQLEQAHQHLPNDNQALLEHLHRVREESERTFGVRLSSLLGFISDHLLTRNERDLQTLLYATRDERMGEVFPPQDQSQEYSEVIAYTPGSLPEPFHPTGPGLQETSVVWLTHTAEAALARADILGELGRLLQLYERSTGNRTDAWFAIDLDGQCVYMNPPAEAFCAIRLVDVMVSNNTLEDVFAGVLPRVRNIDEVNLYLRSFIVGENLMPSAKPSPPTQPHFTNDTVRCIFAADSLAQLQPPSFTNSSSQVWKSAEKATKTSHTLPADHYYQLTRYPLYDRNQQLAAHALRIHDITEQVRDEKNKSALLSSVSHNLRTPLTVIKAAVTGLLQPGVVWDEQVYHEILEEVDSETDHLTVLIDALVEMSRIEMGALVLEKEWCDVAEIVYTVLARAERLLAGRPLRIQVQPRLPLIQADYVQLKQVFHHLIDNAARRSPPDTGLSPVSEIVIILDIVDSADEGNEAQVYGEFRRRLIRVRVIDHGYPVPEEERERIFKTFYAQGKEPGTGLGLAICRGIVEAHQGCIWVEAAPDGGWCFAFTLPVHIFTSSKPSPEELR